MYPCSQLIKHQAKEAGGSAGRAPPFLISALNTDDHSHAPADLSPDKDVFIGQDVGWAPDPVQAEIRCCGEEQYLAPAGNPTMAV
jgi:hypothetical protein